eukprot:g12607.t1
MNINPAPTPTPTPADFWKTWTRVEKKAPAEDAQLVRVSAEFVGISLVDFVYPERWQDLVCSTSRKIVLKKDNATLVHGNAHYHERCPLRKLRWEECPASLASGRILLLRLGRTTCRERTPIFAWAKSSIFWTRRLHRSPILILLIPNYSFTAEEVEVSLARPEYFFSFLPPEFEANIESKHLNPLGELKGDFDDSCPKTGAILPVFAPADQCTPGDVLPFFNFADFDFLQQSLAERARSTHEIAGLKDQLSLMEQRYDTEMSLCAAAVDKQRSIETKAKQELTDLKTKHAAEVASMDQQIKNLKKDVDRLTVSSASQNDDLLATQDNLSSALEDIKALKKTIANRERVLREYRKKITEAKKTGSQAAHEVTRDIPSQLPPSGPPLPHADGCE